MITLYKTLIYQPILNVLIFFYNTIAFQDLGVAIILVTALVRILVHPLFRRGAKHQKIMQDLQPKVKQIQIEHKDNKEKLGHATMALYREHKINPFSSIGLLLLQFPVIIALFQVSQNILSPEVFADLYAFIAKPDVVNHMFLGLINLQDTNILIVGLAAVAQYLQVRFAQKKGLPGTPTTQADAAGKMMLYVTPGITIVFLINFPAALGLYWLSTAAISAFQQHIVNKELHHGHPQGIHQ